MSEATTYGYSGRWPNDVGCDCGKYLGRKETWRNTGPTPKPGFIGGSSTFPAEVEATYPWASHGDHFYISNDVMPTQEKPAEKLLKAVAYSTRCHIFPSRSFPRVYLDSLAMKKSRQMHDRLPYWEKSKDALG